MECTNAPGAAAIFSKPTAADAPRTRPRPGTTAVVFRSREERGEESYGQRARLRVRSGERREYRGGSSAFRGDGSGEGRARGLSRLQHLHRRLQDVRRHRPADGVRDFSSLLHRAHRRRRHLRVRRGDRPGEKRRRDREQRAPSSPRDDRIPLPRGGLRRGVDERRWREERTKRGGIAAREFTQKRGVRGEGLRGHRGRAPQTKIEEKTNRRAVLVAPRPRPREPPRGANQSLGRRERRGGETSASVAAEEVRDERESTRAVQGFLVESGTLQEGGEEVDGVGGDGRVARAESGLSVDGGATSGRRTWTPPRQWTISLAPRVAHTRAAPTSSAATAREGSDRSSGPVGPPEMTPAMAPGTPPAMPPAMPSWILPWMASLTVPRNAKRPPPASPAVE